MLTLGLDVTIERLLGQGCSILGLKPSRNEGRQGTRAEQDGLGSQVRIHRLNVIQQLSRDIPSGCGQEQFSVPRLATVVKGRQQLSFRQFPATSSLKDSDYQPARRLEEDRPSRGQSYTSRWDMHGRTLQGITFQNVARTR